MSELKDNGGPAFPTKYRTDPVQMPAEGMSLRDYFAVHASDGDMKCQAEILRERQRRSGGLSMLPDEWTVVCRYMHADAMLKERTK